MLTFEHTLLGGNLYPAAPGVCFEGVGSGGCSAGFSN